MLFYEATLWALFKVSLKRLLTEAVSILTTHNHSIIVQNKIDGIITGENIFSEDQPELIIPILQVIKNKIFQL